MPYIGVIYCYIISIIFQNFSSIKQCEKEGKEPFFVNATSGSTVMGAYDQLDELAAVCKNHALWLHVDACWGGSFIMSSLHKKHMEVRIYNKIKYLGY